MKLITFASFKGGVGKTTGLMAVASMLASRGKKIAIMDADPNAPIASWEKSGKAKGTWDPLATVYEAQNETLFEDAYEKATEQGCEYALVDTHGGISELNQMMLVNSDFIVVPSGVTDLDVKSTLQTMAYAIELFQAEGERIEIAILWSRFPTQKLTAAEREYHDMIENLDNIMLFETIMHKRDAFTSLGSSGMLHLSHKKLSENPKMRLKARTFGVGVNEADRVTLDILETLGDA